jgi:carbamoyl-phosphate synthase/aspartate carbamoyltransferase/dihydroorotase
VAALWEGIGDGTVDVVESDHAPHTRTEKEGATPPFGLPGLETTLPLLVLAVHEGRLSAERLVELVAGNPQRIFGLRPPPGTETLIDTTDSWLIEDAGLLTSPGWSPFAGLRVWGRVREVRIGGRVAFDGEQVLAAPGSGNRLA